MLCVQDHEDTSVFDIGTDEDSLDDKLPRSLLYGFRVLLNKKLSDSMSDGEQSLSNVLTQEPAEIETNYAEVGCFKVLDVAPDSHKYKLSLFTYSRTLSDFHKTIRREMTLLHSSLPPGIWVRAYQDRMDLFSVMIRGPCKTPYHHGLFFFDIQLPDEYPACPPSVHYLPFCR